VTKKISRMSSPEGEILAEDLEYETIKEDWNIYKLADGTTLKVKMVVQKISRGVMDDQKTIRYAPDGIPMYAARWSVVMAPDVPEELLKKK